MSPNSKIKLATKVPARTVTLGRASKLTKGGLGWAIEGWTFLGSTEER